MRSPSPKVLGHVAAIVAVMHMGCSGGNGEPPPVSGTGGTTSTGGTTGGGGFAGSPGGTTGTGGNGLGGSVSTGGSSTGVGGGGGAPATGGTVGGSGGSAGGTGGVGTGGSSGGGSGGMGVAGSRGGGGGMTAKGGTGGGAAGTGGGGNTGAAGWGKEEDPGAHCTVTAQLPAYSALTADGKLPDPFKMLDGTRITNKSQWACRREELLKQLFNYVYGDKPIPAKGSVSGTVSSSKISVKVTEGSKTTSFDVTVDMNGATAPAPAIICYDGGLGCPLPIPSGVAKIKFTAIEGSGGSGAKTGPFFTFYGSNHPAGYMVAQAWQISRIIDLLEQNPAVIDPYHVGLTGCSRNGKGAFAGGVFDNRVALTIPCESGIGGTPALRLKEQLDPGANDTAEWPYHAISYVRWLSEVALGPFAKSNDAAGDNTDRLPVDMHEAMALIAPRAIYVVDNPGITNLDPKSAYVTGMAGKAIFGALGLADNFAYQGASGSHCQWRSQYDASLTAMIDRFLKGKDSTKTGNFATDLGSKPTATQYYTWDASELAGQF
jgi:hypothetical protein